MATLVLLKGQAGVGKTTLAKQLHHVIGWQYIARDDIKERLGREGCPESELGTRSYDELWTGLTEKLAMGESMICDTNLNQPIALQHIDQLVAKTHAKIVVLACFCDTNTHKKRLESRKNQGLSNFWVDSWDKYQAYLTSENNQGEFEMPYPTVQIDTGKSIDIRALTTFITEAETK